MFRLIPKSTIKTQFPTSTPAMNHAFVPWLLLLRSIFLPKKRWTKKPMGPTAAEKSAKWPREKSARLQQWMWWQSSYWELKWQSIIQIKRMKFSLDGTQGQFPNKTWTAVKWILSTHEKNLRSIGVLNYVKNYLLHLVKDRDRKVLHWQLVNNPSRLKWMLTTVQYSCHEIGDILQKRFGSSRNRGQSLKQDFLPIKGRLALTGSSKTSDKTWCGFNLCSQLSLIVWPQRFGSFWASTRASLIGNQSRDCTSPQKTPPRSRSVAMVVGVNKYPNYARKEVK